MSTTWSLKSRSLLYIISQYMRVVIILSIFCFRFGWWNKFIFTSLWNFWYIHLYMLIITFLNRIFFFFFWKENLNSFKEIKSFLRCWSLLEIYLLFCLFVGKYCVLNESYKIHCYPFVNSTQFIYKYSLYIVNLLIV